MDPSSALQELATRASRYSINLNGEISLIRSNAPLRGSTAIVHRGTLTRGGTEVAVKIFHGTPPGNIDPLKRILREVHLWSKLRHDNVVRMIGISTEFGSTISIVSDWMALGNSHSYIQNVENDPRPLLLDIASGLYYLHSHPLGPIFHGDLKGLNVLVSSDRRALLSDFGLSTLQKCTFSMTVLSPRGGSYPWMAPELLDNYNPSTEGDVWAFGMTVLELFTRTIPFPDCPRFENVIFRLITGKLPLRPSEESTLSRMTDEWWEICTACWILEPSLRPSTEEITEKVKGLHISTESSRTLVLPSPTPSPELPTEYERNDTTFTFEPSTYEPRSFRHPRPPPNNRQNTNETTLPHPESAISSCSDFPERPTSVDRSEESAASGQSNAEWRFVNAIRAAMMAQAATRPPMSPRRDSAWEAPQVTYTGRLQESGAPASRNAQISYYVEKLKQLNPIQELGAHQALVRHLQFSPNGRFLATSSWDATSIIFRVSQTGELSTHRVLVHVQGFIGQVAWSPNGKTLLTRLTRSVKVWNEGGQCKKTIERQSTVQSIVWLPNSEGFLSVEGSEVVKLDLTGKVLDTYCLGRVRLHDVAVTEDCTRLIGVGPSITSPDSSQPSCHTRIEKCLIVYNMQTKRKEIQAPFANDVWGIATARRASVVLISPEKSPPQLWKLEFVRDRDNNCYTSRLSLKHTYTRKAQFELAGPCYFGGRDDQFVLCAGKAGDVYIWDRDSGLLLRYIRPLTPNAFGDLTCMAWNCGTDETFTFATGGYDGAVRLWSTAVPPADETGSESSSFYDSHAEGDRVTTSSLQSG
ncbi:hypothetical protein PISMIDRAFT_687935 [Pisolithus microcarpus 441]|uniref:Protein kinase domain-containing protein n=1 Tax=Pisolithus microcarpus 441 TaxID=765257 RepID=A0A0C9YWH9_9AGAM|nr:kinase-like domain-containing protein [Pisolithus microcarpus]KIK14482.1 hypothetical protein PISMIDRAFT_687935 [Pisolithus microcarpus 441]